MKDDYNPTGIQEYKIRETNKLKIQLSLMCAIQNIISIVCFIVLAIEFNRWYLSLISILFFVTAKIKDEIGK